VDQSPGRTGAAKPLLLVAGAVLLWGTSYAVTKSAYANVPPMYVVWFRMIVALVAFLVAWPLMSRVMPKTEAKPGDWKLIVLLVAFIPCLYFLFEGFAIKFTSSSQAGVVTAVMPLIVALAAWLVLREQPGKRTVIAAVVSVTGVALLSFGSVTSATATSPALGNMLELGAMLAAAGSTLVVKKLSTRFSPLLLTGLQMAAGTVFFAPLALLSGPVDWRSVPAGDWAAIAYLGVGCGFCAFALYNSALRLLPASRAALAINAVPVVALLTGWLGLHEQLTVLQGLAALVILGAVVLAQLAGRPRLTRKK